MDCKSVRRIQDSCIDGIW